MTHAPLTLEQLRRDVDTGAVDTVVVGATADDGGTLPGGRTTGPPPAAETWRRKP